MVQASTQLMPRSIERVTTSRRFSTKVGRSMSPVQPPISWPPIIWFTRFQCPPSETAETISSVLPARRYSMSAQ
ncbi:MAG: hypothetical protein A2V98_09955 [Planctomycetes bacterium RBG_16_64_12]|nr:MAG: hypothetical protein A2V98_09955 [Planctomycetes bacterium RBG_16_64_12]